MSSFTATKTEQPEQKLLILLWKRSKSTKSHTYNIDIFEEEEKKKKPSIHKLCRHNTQFTRTYAIYICLTSKQFRWILHTHKHNLRCHEQHLAWVHQLKKKVKQMHMSNVSHYQILPAAFEMRYSGKWNKNYILEMNIKIMTKKI